MFEPTSPANAAAILRIEAALNELSLGATISYAELKKVAKCDVQHKQRHLLIRAIENVEKVSGCAFAAVRGVGYRRLQSSEAPHIGLAALRKCRSSAKRGKKRLERLSSNSMTEPERRSVTAYTSMLGAVALISDGRKAITVAVVADAAKPIPPENILDMFRTKG